MYFTAVYALLAAGLTYGQLDPVTTYDAVPPAASGPPVGTDNYRLQSFGSGAYLLTDDVYQALFFVTRKSVIMVDAPPTIGNNIIAAIRSVTPLPISHLVYSHAHADHTAAASLLVHPGVTIIAHELTAQQLALAPDPARPPPSVTFKTEFTLRVDNQTLELKYKGPAHEPGNIYIYAPRQKILMLVDIVFPGWAPFASLAEAQNVPAFIDAHDRILEYDFDHYVGGHLTRTGTRQDVLIQREYVKDVYNNCHQAVILSGSPPNATNPISAYTMLPPIKDANPGNSWAVFEGYLDNVARYCANQTTHKWRGKLGGVDVFTFSHAFTMVESLRIDYGVLGPFGVQST